MSTTYSASDLKVGEGWRYSEPQMKLRADALRVLMGKFGEGPYNEYPNRSIYECANEWVEKGFASTQGIVKYYETYYESRQT